MDQEQQAAAKAAAKKAKKLRQKTNRQQAQHGAGDSSDAVLAASDVDALQYILETSPLLGPATCPQASGTVQDAPPERLDSAAGSRPSSATGCTVLPGTTALQEAWQPEEQPSQQPLAGPADPLDSADDDQFLQNLFTCPITKV